MELIDQSLEAFAFNSAFVANSILLLAAAIKAAPALELVGLPNFSEIQFPVSTKPFISIFVSIPIPWSMYTTSSVATFPLAPGANGQPPIFNQLKRAHL